MTPTYTVFEGTDLLVSGPIRDVLPLVHARVREQPEGSILVLQDRTGRVVDLDLRGTVDQALARLDEHPLVEVPPAPSAPPEPRRRGRPRLGVVSREVSLLPRHWEWLGNQNRSASATLRMLIEARMKAGSARDAAKLAATAAYGVMTAVAGDLPGFEEASRALFAHDFDRLEAELADWPQALRNHILKTARPTQEA